MAEEKVPDIEYYFYKDLDNAFFQVVQAINKNKMERENIFANVMYVTKEDGNKDIVVFTSKSDDEDDKGNFKYPRNLSERMRQVDREGLKKVYSLNDNKEVEYTQIYFGDVFDGNISVEPLNTFYNGKRTLTNFISLPSYKNCEDVQCIRKKPKCDNQSYFVDNFIKFSKEEDKPQTNMFCRRYGLIELTEEINNISNYDNFIARLEKEIKTNPVIAFEVENNLRNVGSRKTKDFLAQYRLESIRLTQDERKIVDTIIERQDEPYELFAERLKKYIFSAEPSQRTIGDNVKIFLKYMGSDRIKDFVNRLNAEMDHYYMEEREKMTRISMKEPSILEMTFNVGQRISETITEVGRSGRRKFRDIKKMVEPIYKSAYERGASAISYFKDKRQEQYAKSREQRQ